MAKYFYYQHCNSEHHSEYPVNVKKAVASTTNVKLSGICQWSTNNFLFWINNRYTISFGSHILTSDLHAGIIMRLFYGNTIITILDHIL